VSDFLLPERPVNERATAAGIEGMDTTFGQGFGAVFDDSMVRNPLPSLSRMADRLQYYPSTDEFGNETPARTPSKMLTPDEANAKYGIAGKLKFDADTPEPIAEELRALKVKELERQDTMRRAQSGLGTQLTAGLVASILDPLNVGLAFIPIVGQARFAAIAATRVGVPGARIATGAVEGAAGAAILEPLVLAAARQEQADYDITDSLWNVAFGGILGSGLHLAGGAVGDRLAARREASTFQRTVDDLPRADQEALARAAIAQVVEGRPVDVGPIFDTIQTSRRSQLLSSTSARAFDPGGSPDVRLALETPEARDFLDRIAPDLSAQVDELKQRAAAYRSLLDEMGDDRLQTASARFDEQITGLQAEMMTADKKRAKEIARELTDLYAERVKAREEAAATPGDLPSMTEVRQQLVKTDEALRDLSVRLSEATAKAERKAANVRAQADALMEKLRPALESGRMTDAATFPLDRAPDTANAAERIRAEPVRYTDPEDAAAADTTTRRVDASRTAGNTVADDLKAAEEELAYLDTLTPGDRDRLATTPAEKEANTYAKAWREAAACAVRKG
jgi:hypothetical protein